jgi:hypothetical protein
VVPAIWKYSAGGVRLPSAQVHRTHSNILERISQSIQLAIELSIQQQSDFSSITFACEDHRQSVWDSKQTIAKSPNFGGNLVPYCFGIDELSYSCFKGESANFALKTISIVLACPKLAPLGVWPRSPAIRIGRDGGSMSATGRSSRTMSVAPTSILPPRITRMPLRESLLMYGLDTCRWSAYWAFVINRGVVVSPILPTR